ncbi:50S ribosomal protein L6 [candidate division WS5 bacterium]|uniref:Large ribosomal subunit protein uL6 n=1 Tax=candidate division WS5 bacterium TaxID=2093353 RepID=A0A419DAA3_9BACT|nr:MAG: 50S ribosomal protein L6 [candidate division WS5 bacterium]
MSRIGKLPVEIKEGVSVDISGDAIKVKGPKGELEFVKNKKIEAKIAEGNIIVSPRNETSEAMALWGLTRTLLNNMIVGVSEGFEKKLEFKGTGYRAQAEGEKLTLHMGYNKPVELEIPKGLEVKVQKNTIIVSGSDKQKVGQFAAEIRKVRKPEPYKGKGIRYSDEIIRRKAGKAAAK